MFLRNRKGFTQHHFSYKKGDANGKLSTTFTRKNGAGFTLIEILFVVMVIAVLAAIAIPRIATSTATAKANACKANQAIMNTQIEHYYMDTGSYPATLATVTGDTDYFPDGAPECPTTGSYSMDGTTHRTTCSVTAHKLYAAEE